MTHPRTLVREHVARLLVRNGAWDEAIFVDRVSPIQEDDPFPNVCIYTQSERTVLMNTQHSAQQELTLLIEVREKRHPDMAMPWAHIEGLPNLPGQSHNMGRLLDDACEQIEALVMAEFSRTRLELDGESFDFDQVNEINTDISPSGEGSVPMILAQIEFKLVYSRCFEVTEPTICPLEYTLGAMRHRVGTSEGAKDVPIQKRDLQPALPAPAT